MIAQAAETVGSLAKEQGQIFALLAIIVIASGSFILWLVKYLLNENRIARAEFLAAIDKREEIMNTRNEKILAALDKLSDAVRDKRN